MILKIDPHKKRLLLEKDTLECKGYFQRTLLEKDTSEREGYYTWEAIYYIYKIDDKCIWLIREGVGFPKNKSQEDSWFNPLFCNQRINSCIKINKERYSEIKEHKTFCWAIM